MARLWLPESRGRNALVHSSWLLANTQKLIVATGIANIYARDPMAMANGQRALAEQSGGRFLLGVGVSHRPMVEGLRGHTYGKPVATMRAYLQAMREAPYQAPPPPRDAADRRRGARAADDGAVGRARRRRAPLQHRRPSTPPRRAQILGPGKIAVPRSVGVARDRPGNGARRRAPGAVALPAARKLRQRWRRLRALATTTSPAAAPTALSTRSSPGATRRAIRARIQQHWDAGADHVCIQSISPHGGARAVDERVLELLAPARRS